MTLLAPGFYGAASPASAGMLAPSVERAQGAAQAFGDAARDAWTRLAGLVERAGGGAFGLQRDGILQIARTSATADALRARMRTDDRWLSAEEARQREPLLGEIEGAVLHPGDGVVDAPAAMAALRQAIGAARKLTVEPLPLVSVRPSNGGVTCILTNTERIEADAVVVAAGAWTTSIAGLPRRLPLRPLRGAMIAVGARLIGIPVYEAGGHAYVLPRDGRTLVGATSDDVGFATAPAATDGPRLAEAGARILPTIAHYPAGAPWAGLRPMTPDGMAAIGPDPEEPAVVYAVGHGRNGFLHAALTGECIAALLTGAAAPVDLGPFNPARFQT